MKAEKTVVPIWEKANLTIEEAVEYSNIGEHTLRNAVKQKENQMFLLHIGKKVLIKRKMFEKWMDNLFYLT